MRQGAITKQHAVGFGQDGVSRHFRRIMAKVISAAVPARYPRRETMRMDKTITVTCPKCGVKMTNPVSWFKKPGNCCSGCQLRFATERFKKAIEVAEQQA